MRVTDAKNDIIVCNPAARGYIHIGLDHRVGHGRVRHCRVSMHVYVPAGSAPVIGRSRPYKIGGSVDVEATWTM